MGASPVLSPRPAGHPAALSWPPALRDFPSDHPARLDVESTVAFNEDWARLDFGNSFVDGLVAKNDAFSGDWWLLAMLLRCAELANKQNATEEPHWNWTHFIECTSAMASQKICIHLERANLVGCRLKYVQIVSGHLESANLTSANLEQANLQGIHLENASLRSARLNLSNLIAARLDDALLKSARLSGALLHSASLAGAELDYAKFDGAKLNYANLNSAKLFETVLNGSDVRGVVGLRFNANRVRDIHIGENAPDPWSVLRRTYSGPWFFLHSALLLVFVSPYVGKVVALTAIDHLNPVLDKLVKVPGVVVEHEPAWQVLFGLDKGLWVPMLGVILIVYNVLRGVLTLKVGMLRDAEERSGITPTLEEYMGSQGLNEEKLRWAIPKVLWLMASECSTGSHDDGSKPEPPRHVIGLWRMHRLLKVLFLIAIGSFAFHAAHWLWETKVPRIRIVEPRFEGHADLIPSSASPPEVLQTR